MATTEILTRDARKDVHIGRTRKKSTVGDLIVALTDETRHFVHDDEEVYRIVAYMLTDLLSRSRLLSRTWH